MVVGSEDQGRNSVPQPEWSPLERARAALAVLAAGGGVEAVPAAEALALLDPVFPALPPVDGAAVVGPVDLAAAAAALETAATAAGTTEEAARIAAAGAALRTPLSR